MYDFSFSNYMMPVPPIGIQRRKNISKGRG
jgi:hypothetical protein